jgi:tRNA pseudouridine55 synthase
MRVTGQLPAEIETKKRKIFIEKIEFLEYNPVTATVTLRVLCGKGTYIRALARDLAKAIGTVGYCSALRREALIELFTSIK